MKRNSNPPKKSNGAGRPSLYNDSFPERAFKLCLLGLTDEQLGVAFGVSVNSIDNWKRTKPEFLKAIVKGKQEADAEVVHSLYQRAVGYSHPDVHISNFQGDITVTKITKHYPPDVKAAFGWLFNRDKIRWRDVRRMEHTGADGGPIKVHDEIDLTGLNTEELEFVQRIGLKAKGKNGSGRNRINFPSN